jgi:hypothetical protein
MFETTMEPAACCDCGGAPLIVFLAEAATAFEALLISIIVIKSMFKNACFMVSSYGVGSCLDMIVPNFCLKKELMDCSQFRGFHAGLLSPLSALEPGLAV